MSDVPRETERLLTLSQLVADENTRQNLIASSTVAEMAVRHIDDSIQLLPFLSRGVVLDIGSGGGFPGLVLACVHQHPIHLVEPRTKRAQFLRDAAVALELEHVVIHAAKVERVAIPAVATIVARAVGSLEALFAMAMHLADENTRWVLPKGRTVQSELAAAREAWQGDFALVPSRTDPEAAIVIASRVRRRKRG